VKLMKTSEPKSPVQTIRVERARGGVSVRSELRAGDTVALRKDKWMPVLSSH
jgi:hypothetical protein